MDVFIEAVSDELSDCALTVAGMAIAAAIARETASDRIVIDFIETFLKVGR